jgi:hypothetical protein
MDICSNGGTDRQREVHISVWISIDDKIGMQMVRYIHININRWADKQIHHKRIC